MSALDRDAEVIAATKTAYEQYNAHRDFDGFEAMEYYAANEEEADRAEDRWRAAVAALIEIRELLWPYYKHGSGGGEPSDLIWEIIARIDTEAP